jgi:AcrR family transcriptional regulator
MEGFAVAPNSGLYMKDPTGSDTGRRIVAEGTALMEQIGFEAFTFKKLATAMGSTEATVYRYFENKHRLLLYLVNGYWAGVELRMMAGFASAHSPDAKLKTALALLCSEAPAGEPFSGVDGTVLHRLVAAEARKVWLTKEVDEENREGFFHGYKRLCGHIADLISAVAPDYPFPQSLAATVVEASQAQPSFARHLPRLSNLPETGFEDPLIEFLSGLVFRTATP